MLCVVMQVSRWFDALRAFRAGEPLGDVVMLKLDALSAPSDDVTRRLAAVGDPAPAVDLARLRALPPSTFGRAYARFLDANGVAPLDVSPRTRARFATRPYALRYTATHDLHHVLTGFDTGLAGEIGVLAFQVAQGSAPVGARLFFVARLLYAALAPSQARTIWHDARVGRELGARAKLLIAEPLESLFDEPLGDVRCRLGVLDPEEAGVRPSGTSLLGRALYPKAVG